MVGSLFSWKSLFTNRNTSDDYQMTLAPTEATGRSSGWRFVLTFPTAASPSSTSLTLLLGLLAPPPESAMMLDVGCRVGSGEPD